MIERRMNVSMANVFPSIVAVDKFETRRFWDDDYAKKFHYGQEVFFTSGRYNGNERIALGELLEEPFLEKLSINDTPAKVERLYIAEGFRYLETDFPQKELLKATGEWCKSEDIPYVIKFKILTVIDCMKEKYDNHWLREKCRKIMYKKLTGKKIGQESGTSETNQ